METEIPGTAVLLNLSLLAVTFATVTALVMLVRQTLGGRLSNFDVYLITSYVSLGFVIAIDATLPPIFVLFDLLPAILWPIVSLVAAALLGARLGSAIMRRRKVSPEPMSFGVKGTFFMHVIAIALLIANATVPTIQGTGLYVGALTLSLSVIMWAFVRRVASLLGDTPMEDWDPKRG